MCKEIAIYIKRIKMVNFSGTTVHEYVLTTEEKDMKCRVSVETNKKLKFYRTVNQYTYMNNKPYIKPRKIITLEISTTQLLVEFDF